MDPLNDNSTARLPNLYFVGTSKAGSTWLYELFAAHPDTYVPVAKDLYFWDRYYEFGCNWYLRHFRDAEARYAVDISHDYMYSPLAISRIARACPDARVMCILREPVSRAISTYRFLRRNGQVAGSLSDALTEYPEIVEHGRYVGPVRTLIRTFGWERLWVGVFDELEQDSGEFAANIFEWLDLPYSDQFLSLSRDRVLPASVFRVSWVSKLAKRLAIRARDAGKANLVGRVKRSSAVQRALYRPDRVEPIDLVPEQERKELRALYQDEVRSLSRLLSTDLVDRWGYH